MKLRVKHLKITTGRIVIATLNKDEAHAFGIMAGDRVSVNYKNKKVVAIVDTAGPEIVKPGNIVVFSELSMHLDLKNNVFVNVELEKKPESIVYIRKKLYGNKLSDEEIKCIVQDVADGKLTEVEMAYFIAGGFMGGLSTDETISLTKAMINTGEKISFNRKIIIDKHCAGGVAGNRTTPIVVSILASAGFLVPKTSSRAITSPAGTADTMEVLANVSLSKEELEKVVKKTGACLAWGGSLNLAPTDDKFISVEHPLSIDSKGQLIASVMSKKASVSATHVLIDLPVGPSAKIRDKKTASSMASLFRKVGKALGIKTKVVITDGSQPIGNGLGPALEARDVLMVMQNHPDAPSDLKEKGINMASLCLGMVGVKNPAKVARELLESGLAGKKLLEILKAQGIKFSDPNKIRFGRYSCDVKAPKCGKIISIDNKFLSRVASIAGAPRYIYSGVYLNVHVNDRIHKGDVLFTIYSDSKEKLNFAKEYFNEFDGIKIS